jgi:glycogen operon protein
MNGWETTDGSLGPLGCVWLSDQQAYNFALYSKNASQVTFLLYGSEDFVNPASTYDFNPLRNKTGPIWHTRIPKSQTRGALYYAYSIDGPNSHDVFPYRHAFNRQKASCVEPL